MMPAEGIELLRKEMTRKGVKEGSRLEKAYLLAIYELEREIPEPVHRTYSSRHKTYCRSCHDWMVGLIPGAMQYCPRCGQKVYWEEQR